MSWQPPSAPPSGGYAPTPGGYGPPPGYPLYPAGSYAPAGPAPGLEYATFWRRFGGYLIDVLIVGVISVVVFFVAFGSSISAYANSVTYANQNGLATPTYQLPAGAGLTIGLVGCIFAVLYFGLLVAGWGSTVGQRAVGLRVVGQEDATKNLPMGRALLRAISGGDRRSSSGPSPSGTSPAWWCCSACSGWPGTPRSRACTTSSAAPSW